jgi:hypothetical protein
MSAQSYETTAQDTGIIFDGTKSVAQGFRDFIDKKFEERKVDNFMGASFKCTRAACEEFKACIIKVLSDLPPPASASRTQMAIVWTPIKITDYSAKTDDILDDYTSRVFKDNKVMRLMAKKRVLDVSAGVKTIVATLSKASDTLDKVRVDVVYVLFISETMKADILAHSTPISAPKSNAPSTD